MSMAASQHDTTTENFHTSTRMSLLRSGFNLLEVLIVLAIMAGLMAMTWPNLRRPLQRSSLVEAATTLRSVLDESRYQAMVTGQVWLIQLTSGSGQLKSGTIQQFANWQENTTVVDSTESGAGSLVRDSGNSLNEILTNAYLNQPESNSPTMPSQSTRMPLLHALPEQIEVAEVLWTIRLDGKQAMLESQDELDSDSLSAYWWVPFLANGKSKDCSVRLQDLSTGQSIWLVLSGVTGAAETMP